MCANRLSVVMPAYNERDRIFACVVRAADAASPLAASVQIIVVDDGSTDETAAEAVRASERVPAGTAVQCSPSGSNRGKGHALRQGIRLTDGDVVVLLDGDLDIDPRQMGPLVECVAGGVPLAIATRVHPRSRVATAPHRRILSWGYRLVVCCLLDLAVSDTQCGLKAADGELLRTLAAMTRVDRFAWDAELLTLVHDLGLEIAEFPVQVRSEPKPGRMSWRDVRTTFADTVRVALRRRQLVREASAVSSPAREGARP